jgi:ER-bound oxygenase mpaB/B'/Rubber oxygenase, catalytic domain
MELSPEKKVFNESFLDQMRSSGDELADSVLTEILRRGDISKANEVLAQLILNNNQISGRPMPPGLGRYLEHCQTLPSWADLDKIRQAQVFFTSQGAVFGLVLMCSSLPILYAGGKGGAQVLLSTGKLSGHFRRRASQTLRFILDVMEPGGLEPEGMGIRAIQKVRLMHAAIRHFAKTGPLWKNKIETWGSPINQEELAGTLLAFSSLALEGMKKLQVEISDSDQEAYLHTWKVIGHLLGIKQELLPENLSVARELWQRIDQRNFLPTPEGQQLAVEHLKFLKDLIPEKSLQGFPNSLMHFLMGKRLAVSILKLPSPGWTYYLIGFFTGLLGLQARVVLSSKTLRKLTSASGQMLMESLYQNWNAGDGAPFKIPDSQTGSDS